MAALTKRGVLSTNTPLIAPVHIHASKVPHDRNLNMHNNYIASVYRGQ